MSPSFLDAFVCTVACVGPRCDEASGLQIVRQRERFASPQELGTGRVQMMAELPAVVGACRE
jgi:hypothetical protein